MKAYVIVQLKILCIEILFFWLPKGNLYILFIVSMWIEKKLNVIKNLGGGIETKEILTNLSVK